MVADKSDIVAKFGRRPGLSGFGDGRVFIRRSSGIAEEGMGIPEQPRLLQDAFPRFLLNAWDPIEHFGDGVAR